MKKILKTILLLFLILQPIQQMTAISSKATPTTNIHAPRAITSPTPINEVFPDPNLAEIIRVSFGKSSIFDEVTQQELGSRTHLNGNSQNIINIEGIQYLENINNLQLGNNQISDISVFSSVAFPNLSTLVLSDNQISDISVFSSVAFPNLRTLILSNNQISDISVLSSANFPTLVGLYLGYNQISDISVLSSVNFPVLKTLHLHDNQISDISVLSSVNFPNLRTLFLHRNSISVLPSIDFPELDWLNLANNQISDISVLSSVNLPNLRSLYLFGNKISDISVLSSVSFSNLSTLFLSMQQIINQETIWNDTIHVRNNILGIDGQPVAPNVMSDSGTYNEPMLTWMVPKGTSSVSYTFTIPVSTGGVSTEFSGTVVQPLVEGYTINYLINNQVYQTEKALLGQKLSEPTAPTKTGYRFLGWNTEADGTGLLWDFTTDTMPDSNLDLYAQWGLLVNPDENTGNQMSENIPSVVVDTSTQLVVTGETSLEYLATGGILALGSSFGLLITVKIKKDFLND